MHAPPTGVMAGSLSCAGAHLAISRSTLFAIRRSGLLREGRHLLAKNPTSSRSHLLWHRQRCELALGRIH